MDSKEKIPYEQLLNKKGRARLPDKLMDHLNNEALHEVVWWLPEGTAFAMDSKTVQEKFLDIHFRGTKLTSFIRSLNRWGFRRVFFQAMPRNAICFQCPKFKRANPDLMREMKLAPTTNTKAVASPAAGGGPAAAAGVASTQAMSPSQRPSAPVEAAGTNSRESQFLNRFGNDILGVGGRSGREQLLGGSLSEQAAALSARTSTNMLGGATHQSQSEGMALADHSILQSRAANLLALQRSQMGLLPRDGFGGFLSDQAGSAARLSVRGAFHDQHSLNSLASADPARQDALQVMLQREQLIRQLQDQQRQPQHPLSAIPGQDMGNHLFNTLMSSNVPDSDTAASTQLYRQLQQVRQEQQLHQQMQQEQELHRYLQLRQQQLVNNQLSTGVTGRQNLGETKQDLDPQDGTDDLMAYLRLNQR